MWVFCFPKLLRHVDAALAVDNAAAHVGFQEARLAPMPTVNASAYGQLQTLQAKHQIHALAHAMSAAPLWRATGSSELCLRSQGWFTSRATGNSAASTSATFPWQSAGGASLFT